MLFAADEEFVVYGDRGGDEAFAHVVFVEKFEAVGDVGGEDDTVFAGGVEVIASDNG